MTFYYCVTETVILYLIHISTHVGLYKRRLDNETTRTATLRALTVIAQSPHAQNVVRVWS